MAGGLPFIVLGIAHAFLTPHTPALSPRDASLREAMAKDTLHITRRTTFWRAWTGGVSLKEAADFIAAGAFALGVGAALVDLAALRNGQAGTITEKAR